MQYTTALLLLCLLPSVSLGQDAITLTDEMVHCLESDQPRIVLATPRSVVSIASERGPMRVRAKFADGDGRIETRSFTKEFLIFLEPSATGRTEILLIPLGVQSAAEIERLEVIVSSGIGPRPPPEPGPEPEPEPEPEPTPQPVAKVSLIVVEDVLRRTPETAKVLNAIATWNEFADKGHDWRFYDVKTQELKGLEALYEAKGETLPVLLIRDRKTGKFLRTMPLPTSVESLKRVVREVAGE